jgi:hypothetical protein
LPGLVKLESRLACLREALEFDAEDFDERKPARRDKSRVNRLVGNRVVDVSVSQPAMQGAEITLHSLHVKVIVRIEVEEEPEPPALPEEA